MKNAALRFVLLLLSVTTATITGRAQSSHGGDLRIVIIRHGEKPGKGDNLSCQGLNRSLQLPKLLYKKFGIPDYTYVPALQNSDATLHARMFQTISPFAIRYNLTVNSQFDQKDYGGVAADVRKKTGTVLLVWEHKAMAGIVKHLGIKDAMDWPDDDYDSIWIINFVHGKAVLHTDKEGLHPAAECPL